jgi:divalent metal cation (Fe/Co/Zn/Cd) transporter
VIEAMIPERDSSGGRSTATATLLVVCAIVVVGVGIVVAVTVAVVTGRPVETASAMMAASALVGALNRSLHALRRPR